MWSVATKRRTPACSAWSNALAIPPSSPRPFSTSRSAFVTVSMSFADGSHSCGSAPLGMRTTTFAASPDEVLHHRAEHGVGDHDRLPARGRARPVAAAPAGATASDDARITTQEIESHVPRRGRHPASTWAHQAVSPASLAGRAQPEELQAVLVDPVAGPAGHLAGERRRARGRRSRWRGAARADDVVVVGRNAGDVRVVPGGRSTRSTAPTARQAARSRGRPSPGRCRGAASGRRRRGPRR